MTKGQEVQQLHIKNSYLLTDSIIYEVTSKK
jgi:hypothetical protein